ncbi:hypothetical protein HYDPIDRAFT_34242 [Hydnomerulius pinastri MD-312]|uniref:Uncharacterized protein n=1 Tax=Hydnomerulius pinastri MD-312 TaxID=994086 RepID=A0A0C9VYA5_9AGAM|nr:hypothetical protein HYDPIDRAFT_34242 [Hydnomerulius pinastri MD-312]
MIIVQVSISMQILNISTQPPEWAKELINGMIKMHERLHVFSPRSLNASMHPRSQQSYAESSDSRQPQYRTGGGETEYTKGGDEYDGGVNIPG